MTCASPDSSGEMSQSSVGRIMASIDIMNWRPNFALTVPVNRSESTAMKAMGFPAQSKS